MPDIDPQLTRWQTAGDLDAGASARIRAHETDSTAAGNRGFHWLGAAALFCAAILIACGVILLVSERWNELSPGVQYVLVIALVSVFHLAGGMTRASLRGLSIVLHAAGTVSTGAAVMLVGEIFNIEYHWPSVVFLWALAALAGWMLLRDHAQQILALLLIPAWIFCEIGSRANAYIGDEVYLGRLLFVWGVFYFTFFLGSRRKAVKGVLFAAGAIAAAVGIFEMLFGWISLSADQSFIPFGTRVWAWVAIAAVPLVVAAFHGHKGLVPIAAAIAFSTALPWCYSTRIDTYSYKNPPIIEASPNLLSYALVAAFAAFLCWWGARLGSRALVNLGIAGFAGAVAWFYFSHIYSDTSRAMGLIGLGVLFLAGGWALEFARRRILAGMKSARRTDPRLAAGQDATRAGVGGAQ